MRRSRAVPLALTALLAASLTGCADDDADDPDSYAICVDPQTDVRLDDDECDDDGRAHGGAWYYFGGIRSGSTYVVPRVGGTATGGTFSEPSGTVVRGGVSAAGGSLAGGSSTVSHGGFGGSSKAGGGG